MLSLIEKEISTITLNVSRYPTFRRNVALAFTVIRCNKKPIPYSSIILAIYFPSIASRTGQIALALSSFQPSDASFMPLTISARISSAFGS